jgi:hypothetical protein
MIRGRQIGMLTNRPLADAKICAQRLLLIANHVIRSVSKRFAPSVVGSSRSGR